MDWLRKENKNNLCTKIRYTKICKHISYYKAISNNLSILDKIYKLPLTCLGLIYFNIIVFVLIILFPSIFPVSLLNCMFKLFPKSIDYNLKAGDTSKKI